MLSLCIAKSFLLLTKYEICGQWARKKSGSILIAEGYRPAVIVGMPAFDPEATGFSAKNALLFARLANAAYGTREEAEAAVKQLGFSDFYWMI